MDSCDYQPACVCFLHLKPTMVTDPWICVASSLPVTIVVTVPPIDYFSLVNGVVMMVVRMIWCNLVDKQICNVVDDQIYDVL